MKLVPYDHPRLVGFKSSTFKRSTVRWKGVVERMLFEDKTYAKGLQDLWVLHAPAPYRLPWTPKLYACVGPQSYWPMIVRLIERMHSSRVTWKFFMAPSGYERPDKICFYFRSAEELRAFVPWLRPLMPQRGTHVLHHTASTFDLGIEPEGTRGLFVGIDPPLPLSWRIYRCLCVAWAEVNRSYLEERRGGADEWFVRMNISRVHEGPHTLTPDPKDEAFVKRAWSFIDPNPSKGR